MPNGRCKLWDHSPNLAEAELTPDQVGAEGLGKTAGGLEAVAAPIVAAAAGERGFGIVLLEGCIITLKTCDAEVGRKENPPALCRVLKFTACN